MRIDHTCSRREDPSNHLHFIFHILKNYFCSHNGTFGVSLCAPGSAEAAVPKWRGGCQDLKRGTSMASPFVAGVCAHLMRMLDMQHIAHSVFTVHLALVNTCRLRAGDDRLAMGAGLVQPEAALQYHVDHKEYLDGLHSLACIAVKIVGGGEQEGNAGVYLRGSIGDEERTFDAKVELVFRQGKQYTFSFANSFFRCQRRRLPSAHDPS